MSKFKRSNRRIKLLAILIPAGVMGIALGAVLPLVSCSKATKLEDFKTSDATTVDYNGIIAFTVKVKNAKGKTTLVPSKTINQNEIKGNYEAEVINGIATFKLENKTTSDFTCAFQVENNNVKSKNSIEVTFNELEHHIIAEEHLNIEEGVLLGFNGTYDPSWGDELVVPTSVTTIYESAFYNCSGLTSLTISNSVTTIDYYAFESCSGLTSLTIPNTVTTIYEGAFYNCSGLTSLDLTNFTGTIDYYAFYNCSGLTNLANIHLPDTGAYTSFSVYNDASFKMIYDTSSKNQIGCLAFGALTPTVMNTIGIIDISNGAFSDCFGLTSVAVPNTVTAIHSGAFSDCFGLTSLDLTNFTGTIDDYAFSNCSGLTNLVNIHLPSSSTNYSVYDTNTFKMIYDTSSKNQIGCLAFGALTPNIMNTIGIDTIGNYAFESCSGLTSLNVPNTIADIGDYAFSGCSGLTSLTIPNTVTPLGNVLFLTAPA